MSTRIGTTIFVLAGLTALAGCQTTEHAAMPSEPSAAPAYSLIQPMNRAAGADTAANEDFAAAVAALAANPQSGVRQVGAGAPAAAPMAPPVPVMPSAVAAAPVVPAAPAATEVAAQPAPASPFVLPSYAPAPMLVPAAYPNVQVQAPAALVAAPAAGVIAPPQNAAEVDSAADARRIRRF